MTKEEFDTEVYEYAKSRIDTEDSRMADRMLAYRAGAEPREKHIAELKKQLDLKEKALSKAKKETKRIADRVNKDKRRLIRRKAELEAQIEKMKCCYNCANDTLEPPEVIGNGICEHCKNHDKWELED